MLGENLSFAASEAYKLLRANLMFALPDEQRCRVVGMTSSMRGEGKSTTTVNLGYSLAQAGKRVLIIEADMRMPMISKRLELKSTPGLSNLLAGLNDSEEVLQSSGLHDNLWVISAGDIPPNPSELLGSDQMRAAIEMLCKGFDFILLDLPPVTTVSDPLVASKLVNGMILVVRQNYSNRRSLSETVRQLRFANAKLLGFVLTGADISAKGGEWYRKRFGYDYSYSNSKSQNGGEKNP